MRNRANNREWQSFINMRRRCYESSHNRWPSYGGKGIKVCARWLVPRKGFSNFLADMGPRPEGTTIDRINNKGNYTPENCRWADVETQMRNRSNAIWLTYKGEKRHLMEWAEILGLQYKTIHKRIRDGWTTKEVIETPHNAKRKAV